MKTVDYKNKSFIFLGLAAIVTGSINFPSFAASPFQKTSVTSQATPNLCRRVNSKDGLVVRSQANSTASVVGGVAMNTQITLVNNQTLKSADGRLWVEISAPMKGFISSGYPNNEFNLVPCSGSEPEKKPDNKSEKKPDNKPEKKPEANQPKPTTSLCRQIEGRVAPNGIIIRADASTKSAVRGGVIAGEKVTLVKDYKLIKDKDGDKRDWIEITAPIGGFITTNSLIMCKP